MVETSTQMSMYAAIPTRTLNSAGGREKIKAIKQFIFDVADCVPFVAFDAGPYEYTEGNPRFGRERSLAFDLAMQRACDLLGMCGISPGTLGEWLNALAHSQPIRLFRQFDPEWDKFYAELSGKYRDPANQHRMFAFVGPRAIGKTHLINYLLHRFPDYFERVRNTTTRKRREGYDKEAYEIVSRDEFEDGIERGQFFEWDEYRGNYYGSSRQRILEALSRKNGIFAITPKGATSLYDHRFDINLCPILLKPKDQDVLPRNAKLRCIDDAGVEELLKDAPKFFLPEYVRHALFEVSGTQDDYGPFVSTIVPLMKVHEG